MFDTNYMYGHKYDICTNYLNTKILVLNFLLIDIKRMGLESSFNMIEEDQEIKLIRF